MQSDYLILITLGVLIILSPFVKSLMQRIGVPAPVGYIALGFLVSILDQQWRFITSAFENAFLVLAQLGVVGLLFRVGLKSHTKALLRKLPDASFIWLGDVLTNLLAGFLVSHYVLALTFETSLVVATAFSATSVAVSVSVWEELKLLNSGKGVLLVDVAELDDLSRVLLLAMLLALIPVLQSGDGDLLSVAGATAVSMLLKLALFVVGCYLFAHYLEEDFTRLNREMEGSDTALSITILGTGLAIAALAGLLGFSLAIGALFAGLAFSRDPKAVRTDAKFAYFYEFFTPFFFIHIGMQVDPAAFFSSIEMGLLLFIVAALGKVIGVAGPALLSLGKTDAMILGVSMIPRAEIALVVVYQCHQLSGNIVPEDVYAGMVVVSILTSTVAPPILRSLLAKEAGRQ